MSTAQQVIDDIDALVDEQMAGGEAKTGYDYDDPDYPRCRCGCKWHGLIRGGCPGSDSEGPLMATGLRFGTWAGEPALPSRRLGHFDPADSIAAAEGLEQIVAAFRVVSAEVSRVWESMRRTLLGLPHPQAQSQSRCTLAARRRMHSDQLRVQRRAVRRERRARQREAKYDPLEVHDDHVILTLTPDVSGFRRELRRTYDQP